MNIVWKKMAVTCLLFCLSATAAVAAPEQTPATSQQTSMDRFFVGLQTLTAEFEQTLFDAQGTLTQTATGRLSIQRPGRFRWDYTAPYQQLVLGDGERIWTFDADLEQATVRAQQDALAGTPALLLSAGEQPRELFTVHRLPDRDQEQWYELLPLTRDTQFNRLRLGFLGDNLVGMELIDGFDQLTVFRFSGLNRNGPVSAALFHFEPPPGVDVIGQAP